MKTPSSPVDNPLKKRIKRQVTARTQRFFIATAPGISGVCQKELENLIKKGDAAARITPGGITVSGKPHLAYKANLHLRTANRVLMRLDRFKATNFRKLEKKVRDFPWELYLFSDSHVAVRVSSSRSRLYHGEAVADRFRKAIHQRVKGNAVKAGLEDDVNEQSVFVRLTDDLVTVSLDSSGRILHKRGVKTHGAIAPLRETTAAAALMLAGYNPDQPLIDPMCGSGTFTIEAAMMATGIPAGWFRRFSFMGWPCFRRQRFDHMRKEAASRIKNVSQPAIFASDTDTEACSVLEKCLKSAGLSDAVNVARGRNFFDLEPAKMVREKGTVVLNPPHGHRMGSQEQTLAMHSQIIQKLICDYQGWKLAYISPEPVAAKNFFSGLNTIAIFHGGLNLRLSYGRIGK